MAHGTDNGRQGFYRIDDLVLDTGTRTLRRDDENIDLPDLSLRLLTALARGAPETVPKDELMRQVWGQVVVGDETLAQRVRLLRQALGDDSQNPRYIKAVRGRGYRLIGSVSKLSAPPSASTSRRTNRRGAILLGGAVVLIALIVAMALLQPGDTPSRPAGQPASLAVLPFSDLSQDGDQAYLADGLHEELLGRLTTVDGLAVTSRTSVLPYRSSRMSIRDIAAELGVSAVLEGSVRLANEKIRISAQLIDGRTDRHLWAETFERTFSVESLFDIQTEIAARIADALSGELVTRSDLQPVQLPTASLEAYNLYLRGRFHTFRTTVDDLNQAVALLSRATQLDPGFAHAYATLGTAYSFHGTAYGAMTPAQAFPKAKEAALTALALNPELVDARALYADILAWYDWDWAKAENEYRRVAARGFDYNLGYALLLSALLRHDEATTLVERAIDRYPDDRFVRINAAWRFLNARDYARAVIEARASVKHPDKLTILGWAELGRGNHAQGLSYFEQNLVQSGPSPGRLSNVAVGYARSGRLDDAREILQQLEAVRDEQHIDPSLLAEVYLELKDLDRGFELVDESLQQRNRSMIFLQVNHSYDDVRTDERYLRLIDAMGFPPPPAER